MVNVGLTLKEGGKWWQISMTYYELMIALNTGLYNGQKIYAVSCRVEGSKAVYDFVLKQWR